MVAVQPTENIISSWNEWNEVVRVSLPHKKKIGAVERIERSGHLGLVFDRLHDARDAVVDELREDRRREDQPEACNSDARPICVNTAQAPAQNSIIEEMGYLRHRPGWCRQSRADPRPRARWGFAPWRPPWRRR